VRPERFELPTNWFEASYSIQLSYGRMEEGGLYRFLASEEGLCRQYHGISAKYSYLLMV
jgi:hypothetical protein